MNDVLITLDTDWAPDTAIDLVAGLLLQGSIRATWFVTHSSPAIDRLRSHPELFELGIHPNFMAKSSHGGSPTEVLEYCMKLVPGARSVRTHGLVQSTALLDLIFTTTSVTTDVSILLPRTANLRPCVWEWKQQPYLRIPYFWEDDVEMERLSPDWEIAPMLAVDGLKVFDFHPIHILLNSADMRPYQMLKKNVPRLSDATDEEIEHHIYRGPGSRTMFEAVVAHLAERGSSHRISDLSDLWRRSL